MYFYMPTRFNASTIYYYLRFSSNISHKVKIPYANPASCDKKISLIKSVLNCILYGFFIIFYYWHNDWLTAHKF